MRLTVLLLIAGLFLAHGEGMSQSITFTGKDIAMKDVFQVIEQQTGYVISGDKSILTSSKPVSVTVTNVPLDQFLYLIFKDQKIAFRIRGKNIFLSRSRDPSTKADLSITADPAPFPLAIINGTVRSRKGELPPGASVRLKGMPSGTSTDAQGSFSLRNIPEKTILQISSIGYETIELIINEAPEGYTATAVKRELT